MTGVRFHGHTYSEDFDERRLTNNAQRVFALMLDGKWHTPSELREVGGSNWGARVRSLRESQFGSLVIETKRSGGTGGRWEYRLDLGSMTEEARRRILEWKLFPKDAAPPKPVDRCCPACLGTGRVPLQDQSRQTSLEFVQ